MNHRYKLMIIRFGRILLKYLANKYEDDAIRKSWKSERTLNKVYRSTELIKIQIFYQKSKSLLT